MRDTALILLAYLIGCFNTGYYLTRWRTGADLRRVGSTSTGARNAGRILGRSGFILTFLGDVGKGVAALALVRWSGAGSWVVSLAIIAVVAGHVWPVQLGFTGGKGMSVALGALLVFDVRVVLVGALVTGFALLGLRRRLVSGMLAVATLPLVVWAFRRSAVEVGAAAVVAGIILFAHRGNIRAAATGQRRTFSERQSDSCARP